ncbi:hypothetical protein ACOU9B_000385 [Enterococcus hirae]
MMNTIIYSQENKIKNSANLFNKNFNNYLEQLSSLIKKKNSSYNEDFEELYDYHKEISERANLGKDSQIQYITNILNKSLMVDLKKDEFENIFKYYNKRIEFENTTKNKRKIEKSLDITNEIYGELIETIKILENNYKQDWTILDESILAVNSSNKLRSERIKNVKTSIKY